MECAPLAFDLLVEALCFILENENVGNFRNEQEWHDGSALYSAGLFVYFMSYRFSYDLHYHNIVLQFHASLFQTSIEVAEGLSATHSII